MDGTARPAAQEEGGPGEALGCPKESLTSPGLQTDSMPQTAGTRRFLPTSRRVAPARWRQQQSLCQTSAASKASGAQDALVTTA